jgi:acyl dehydratase
MGEPAGGPGTSRPVDQAARLTDEAVEAARRLVGVWLRRDVHAPACYEPLSLHDIRRWAWYGVGDDNPLWSDAEYAKRTPWGVNIAPPTFLYTVDTTIVAPGLPGVQWIFGGSRWELLAPVRAGDLVTARARLIAVEVKAGHRAPRFAVQTGEVLFEGPEGRPVARCETDILRVPRRRSGEGLRFEDAAGPGGPAAVPRYTPEEIAAIAAAYRQEVRRGAEPRYWEDVAVDDALPTLHKGPLTLVDIVGFYAGRRTVYPVLRLASLERDRHPANVYVSPRTGIPVHPAAGHFDAEIAHEVGMPGAYDQGWMRMNWAGHLLTDWCGDAGLVRRLHGRVSRPNLVGDLTVLTGRVTGRRRAEGEALVDVAWWGTDRQGRRNCEGTATVRLPSRDPALRW